MVAFSLMWNVKCVLRRGVFCTIVGCGARLSSLEDFEDHYNARHTASCSVCSRVYPTSRLLSIHVSEAHDSFFQAKVARGYPMVFTLHFLPWLMLVLSVWCWAFVYTSFCGCPRLFLRTCCWFKIWEFCVKQRIKGKHGHRSHFMLSFFSFAFLPVWVLT